MKLLDKIDHKLGQWIAQQPLFFVASAPLDADGHVNVSPRGYDCLRILDEHTLAWLDLTGSGNETAAHVQENGRLTLMFCAFQGAPQILRLYGQGEVILPGDVDWQSLAPAFPPLAGARQIIRLRVERIQTSCGYGIPLMRYEG
ncbi:MAG: pyridoxamine 5'-phosphate oxidase family protein, partial [Gammaproteobacteria bacterium]